MSEEKYFVFRVQEDGSIEFLVWFKTLEEAQEEVERWKILFPEDAGDVFTGERIE